MSLESELGHGREPASQNPNRGVAPLVALALSLAVAAGALGFAIGRGDRTVADPDTLPAYLTEFELPGLDGVTRGPEDYRGQILIVDFWATWCGPCRIQERILERMHESLEEQGQGDEVAFLAVNVGEALPVVRSFVDKSPFPYPVVYDEDATLMHRAGIQGLPTVMVVGPGGEVAHLSTGVTSQSRLDKVVESLREGEAVPR